MKNLAPEEIELNKKRRVLERLKDRLADREEEMTELRAELEQTEATYTMQVGRYYAELDEIEAQIAEEELKLVPDDEEIKKKVEELRRRAEESAAEVDQAKEHCNHKFSPTPEAKKAYHNLAKLIHPDLAIDEEERTRRHSLMAKLNDAYAGGDQKLLDKLVDEFRDSPEMIRGDSVGDHLVRAIRRIFQVAARLNQLKTEKFALESSEAYQMREKIREEQLLGRDYFKQMAERTKTFIMKSERRLMNLKNLNVSQEDYVREKYGMDISEFRK